MWFWHYGRDDPLYETPVDGGNDLSAFGVYASDDIWYSVEGESLVPGIYSLRRANDTKVAASNESGLFQNQDHNLDSAR